MSGTSEQYIDAKRLPPMIEKKIACQEFVALLGEYIDGDLSAQRRSRMDAHRAGCAQCAAYHRSYAATVKLVNAAGAEPEGAETAPPDLVRSIIAARHHR